RVLGGERVHFRKRARAVERVGRQRGGQRVRPRDQRQCGDRQREGDRQQGRAVQAPVEHLAEDSYRVAPPSAKPRTGRQISCGRVLQPVAVASKPLADYTHICGRELIAEIRELAQPLKDRRVVHISATAFGGGVSEILYALVPLMRDVGLDCEWQVIYGREEFFNATKLLHNALQGAPLELDDEQWATWRQYNEMNAHELSAGWDVCLVHDPQPAALYELV